MVAPGNLWKPEVQVAQRAADGDVGQAHVDAGAVGLVAQTLAEGQQAVVDLAHLPVDPGLTALAVGAAGPGGLQAREDGRIHDAVGQRLPGLDLGPFAATAGWKQCNAS